MKFTTVQWRAYRVHIVQLESGLPSLYHIHIRYRAISLKQEKFWKVQAGTRQSQVI